MRHGESFEQYVLNMVRMDGFGLVMKTDPPVRVIRWAPGHNRFTGCFLEEGMLDLTGSVRGLHVEIEVKDCKGMRFPFSKIRKHQLRRMRDLADDKALAGLALRLRGARADDDRVFFVPAQRVVELVDEEKKSVNVEMLEELVELDLACRHLYRRRGDVKKFVRKMIDASHEP